LRINDLCYNMIGLDHQWILPTDCKLFDVKL